ncbi:MAG: hypothetical protein HY986_02585 [Candidatus Melainabacteria bacterium]|nr:hypothetical protein [Candidatus Melainabacteria bacterium]
MQHLTVFGFMQARDWFSRVFLECLRMTAVTALMGFSMCCLAACVIQDEFKENASKDGNLQGLRVSKDSVGTALLAKLSPEDVEPVAAEADRQLVDGWICGRDPRTFKSPYRTVSPREKALFALAYRDFIAGRGQNLGLSLSTYIPYQDRSRFARQYWEKSALKEEFAKETEKYQICWIHESLLDGSELVFRAAERKFGQSLDSALIMAHDVEQNMVSKYMADERTESSFAMQFKPKSESGKSGSAR